MNREFRALANHYLFLFLLLGCGLGGIMFFKSNLPIQQIILWITIGGYTAWGVAHHIIRKDLTISIVMEYFLVGIIAGIFIQATLLAQ